MISLAHNQRPHHLAAPAQTAAEKPKAASSHTAGKSSHAHAKPELQRTNANSTHTTKPKIASAAARPSPLAALKPEELERGPEYGPDHDGDADDRHGRFVNTSA